MLEDEGWQRARRPPQKDLRRQIILESLVQLLESNHPADVTMRALADKAGLAASGIYRYFSTKESALLALYIEDLGDLRKRFASHAPPKTLADACDIYAQELLDKPRVLLLMSLLPSLIERNVPADELIEHKLAMMATFEGIASQLVEWDTLPDQAAARTCIYDVGFYASGLYPLANPPPTLHEVLTNPQLRHFKIDLERTLRAGVQRIAHGNTSKIQQ